LYFYDFGLYLEFKIVLDCIEVYLYFNKNYNNFFKTEEKNVFF